MPRALCRRRRLATLYTDFWPGPVVRRLTERIGLNAIRSLASRFHPELAGANVVSWNSRSMLWEAGRRQRLKHAGSREHFEEFIDAGRQFAIAVREALRKRQIQPRSTVLFAYDTGALEAFEWCRERRICCVLDQMDPNRVEVELVRQEAQHWPGWELHPLEVPEAYFERREQEWALADLVVVNSAFCKQALIRQGVAAEKLFVLPLCYEPGKAPERQEVGNQKSGQPLRVLFLGQVILRKGIQYLIEAARSLEQENIRFDVVGPIGISERAIGSAPHNLTFHGRTSRALAAEWYAKADVFVLPTLSDGFAITQLEAMAHGLPVVTTPCCGEVVSDGLDGFVVPPRDVPALTRALQRYLSEPGLLRHQSEAALEKSRRYSLETLAGNLDTLDKALGQL